APRSLLVSPLLWAVRLPQQNIQTCGSPRFLGSSFPARCLQAPREAQWLLTPAALPPVSGFILLRETGRFRYANEAESSSLSLRLAGSPCKASCCGLLPFHTLARLR